MTLPPIDIPLKLPFEVPLLVHPLFVHFAIAIPVIVFLIELVNLKTKSRAASVTSLSLLVLAMIVFAGAFFTGKADGSDAFALLGEEAKGELGFHKLLGTYLVYGIGVLFLLKILAMMIRQNWMRTIFLLILLVFIGLTFKQGKDGGELVYKYGVNVEAVTNLQNEIDDLKDQLKTAKEECAAKKESESASEEPAVEPKSEAPANESTESAPKEPAQSSASEESMEESGSEATTEESTEDNGTEIPAESEAPAQTPAAD